MVQNSKSTRKATENEMEQINSNRTHNTAYNGTKKRTYEMVPIASLQSCIVVHEISKGFLCFTRRSSYLSLIVDMFSKHSS